MNQLKSHHMERLWVTLSSPSDPSLSLWASPNELFIYYSEMRIRHVAGTEVLWRIAMHAKRLFFVALLKPDESAIPFQAYLHTALTYSAYVHGMKVQISQQSGFMLIKLFGTRFSWIHAVMRIFSPRFLRSITCYHLMADALIWLMYNAQALTNKFSWDDWSCLKDDIPLTFGFDWNCHTLR